MHLKHFFLPHPDTHKKAHLLSVKALVFYIAFFIILQFSFKLLSYVKPGVLGITSNVTKEEIVHLVNLERQTRGLDPLFEDSKLSIAAEAKGRNMFEENYWAHYSPSGKDPWSFILNAGYKFTYAGENLAKNFYTSSEAVSAWMNSPTHRDNILSNKYRNIGVAVVEGVLNGQTTTVIVQEFGSPVEAIAQKLPNPPTAPIVSVRPDKRLTLPQNAIQGESIDPYALSKSLGLLIFVLLTALILADYLTLKKRAVIPLTSRHLPHLALLSLALGSLIKINPGAIL